MSNIWVEKDSRWMGRQKGELVVWRVVFYYQAGSRDSWHIFQYDVECEETGQLKEIPHDQFQQLIAEKRLINIGEHTKEQWIKMSKGK